MSNVFGSCGSSCCGGKVQVKVMVIAWVVGFVLVMLVAVVWDSAEILVIAVVVGSVEVMVSAMADSVKYYLVLWKW